jgi:hypothetical protein
MTGDEKVMTNRSLIKILVCDEGDKKKVMQKKGDRI